MGHLSAKARPRQRSTGVCSALRRSARDYAHTAPSLAGATFRDVVAGAKGLGKAGQRRVQSRQQSAILSRRAKAGGD